MHTWFNKGLCISSGLWFISSLKINFIFLNDQSKLVVSKIHLFEKAIKSFYKIGIKFILYLKSHWWLIWQIHFNLNFENAPLRLEI